jgi:hypothetical protein
MYKIKGQDQKEYGPVDAAQVRQWLSQGRADAQTLAQSEGAADWRPLGSFAEFAAVNSPPPLPHPAATPPPDSTIATIIPYRNVSALIAYYLGVFSIIPCVGFVLGIAAFILGIIGLKRARQYPEAKGKVHAWIGIILGAFVVLAHIACVIIIFAAASRNAHAGAGAGWHM